MFRMTTPSLVFNYKTNRETNDTGETRHAPLLIHRNRTTNPKSEYRWWLFIRLHKLLQAYYPKSYKFHSWHGIFLYVTRFFIL